MTTSERKTLFADMLIPLPVPGLFTYRIPFELNDSVMIGQRAVVQFGEKKVVAAIVVKIHEQIPANYTPKYIMGLLDDKPIVNQIQLDFWNWIHQYYMCHLGEVMASALPGGLKLTSESKIELNREFVHDAEVLTDNEFIITEALSIQPQLSITEVTKIVGFQKVMPLIKTMIEKKIVVLQEELQEKFKAKTERVAKISEVYADSAQLKQLMDNLSQRAYKQLEIVMAYIQLSRFPMIDAVEIPVKKLLEQAKATTAQFKTLVDKNIFVVSEKVVSRLQQYSATHDPLKIALTEPQQKALQSVELQLQTKDVVLLHGVTSSGKTEMYIKLIASCLAEGRQVLYLLPEIALTTQIIQRLKMFFGKKIGVYHSRYNVNEKVEIWNKVLEFDENADNEHQIILGPRSALFLPFSKLGLIIVDEEHDSSFKQIDPTPRYHARDAAIVLAKSFGAKVVLGSATPSFESYYNSKTEKYGFVALTERFGGVQMPEITIANLREEKKRKTLQSHFSSVLMKEIKQAVALKEQVILFQNRRGFSLRIECDKCNFVPECRNCDVSLIYHKKQNMLRCHYCGYAITVPETCPNCHSTELKMHGFGTEKVEEELGLLLPEIKIARLDLDTTRSKYAFEEIIQNFSAGKSNILVGTQMVTKGLDFEKVSIVGILNADNMLSYPDFRAFERSFQLMAQVSGRAGRKQKRGKVIIQTYQPNHQMMNYVLNNDYENLFHKQMGERKKYDYPPFFRLIMIRLLHRDNHLVNLAAYELSQQLKKDKRFIMLGPEYPIVSRIKSLYIKQIIIKFPRTQQAADIKKFLETQLHQLRTSSDFKSIKFQVDVDPQ